jgi:magnesium transporter
MHIDVDTKPVTPNTYDTKKKRLIETIDRLYHRDARSSLQKMLGRLHPADLASILDDLPPEHMVDIFHVLDDKALASEVFGQMNQGLRQRVMTESSPDATGQPARTSAPG